MSNFSKAKKYFTKSEIETKIKELLSESEMQISDLNSVIAGLKIQIEKQQKEIIELKKREKIIRTALISATEQAKVAYDEAKDKHSHDLLRLEKFYSKYESLINDKKVLEEFSYDLSELIKDFKMGVGAGELARRRELEKARKKIEEANKNTQIAQKDIEQRYKLALEKYQQLAINSSSEFSIEEALNPTASLEEIMKEILKK